MNSARTISGRPIRNGTEVADAIVDLVASTLDPSPHLTAEHVRTELAGALPALALLASGGHLVDGALVLVAGDLRLVIKVPVGEGALTCTENTEAPRGAATATDWTLHLPCSEGTAALAKSAASTSTHVSTESPPSSTSQSGMAAAATSGIDLTRLLDGSDN